MESLKQHCKLCIRPLVLTKRNIHSTLNYRERRSDSSACASLDMNKLGWSINLYRTTVIKGGIHAHVFNLWSPNRAEL